MTMQRWTSLATVGPELCTSSEAMAWARVTQTQDAPIFDDLIVAGRELFEELCHRVFVVQQGKLTIDYFPNNDLGWWQGVKDGALASYQSRAFDTVNPPLISVDAFNYYDLANVFNMYDPSQYFVDNSDPAQIGRVCLNLGSIWPVNLRRNAAIEVHLTCGYGTYSGTYTPPSFTDPVTFTPGSYTGGVWSSTAPRNVVTALKMLVAYLYEHRGEEADTSVVSKSGAMGFLRSYILPEPGLTKSSQERHTRIW